MRINEFLDLPKIHESVRQVGADRWQALCPAHDDHRTKSLCISTGADGRILLDCKAGCKTEAVCGELGIGMKDLFVGGNGHDKPQPAQPRPTKKAYGSFEEVVQAGGKWIESRDGRPVELVRAWTYDDSFRILRFNYSDSPAEAKPNKTFLPAYHNEQGWTLQDPPRPLPLYSASELRARPGERVFVVEGEKCVEAARSIGLLATTSSHGAGAAKHTDWGLLADRDVAITPDNDPGGDEYKDEVCRLLLGLTPPARVRIVRLPGLPPKGDIYDWLEERDELEPEALRQQIEAIAEKADPPMSAETVEPKYRWMAEVTARPVEWLWRNRFPMAMLSLLIGMEGRGKSFVALDMAARITSGRQWTDAENPNDAPTIGNVIYMTDESHLEYEVKPRLDAMRADHRRIAAMEGIKTKDGEQGFDVLHHIPALEKLIEIAKPVRLIVVDPLTSFLGETDQHRNGEVRAALSRFSALAERHSCAIVGISHLSKDAGKAAIHRCIGSVAFTATARAVWLVAQDRDDEDRRLFCPVKMNLGPMPKSLAFRIEDLAVQWEDGQFDCQADEILTVDATDDGPKALTDACNWLRDLLADGRVRSTEIKGLAKREGISEPTLKRAKAKLGIDAVHEGIGSASVWYWVLAQEDQRGSKTKT